MFLGHFAVAYASKRLAPRPSLGTLFLAAQWADLLWPMLVLLGVERVEIAPGDTAAMPLHFTSRPYTHSLIADIGWALVLGGLYYALRRDNRGALLVAAGVVSHWVLDVIVHRADMPILLTGPKIGLGLWNAPVAEAALELALLGTGLVVYARATRAVDRIGRYATWALPPVLLVSYLASLMSPPPPSVVAAAWERLVAGWLWVLWAYWADAHRVAREAVAAVPSPGGPR